MTRPKKCSTCQQEHDPPRGKKCTRIPDPTPEASIDDSLAQKILDKLTAMESRITAIENIHQPKDTLDAATSNPALNDTMDNVGTLRGDLSLQQQVSARLRDLGLTSDTEDSDTEVPLSNTTATTSGKRKRSKLKSGRDKTVSAFAKLYVEWPHYHVYRGTERKPARFDDLSPVEFTFGALNIILDGAVDSEQQRAMLGLLRDTCSDAMEYTWENARGCYAIILQQMEQGRLTWTDTAAFRELRRTYAQKQILDMKEINDKGQSASQAKSTAGPLYCYKFQEGTCRFSSDHKTTRGAVRHICAYCLKSVGAAYSHAEHECQRKIKHQQAKNDEADA